MTYIPTHDEKAIHFETWEHIHQVRKLLTVMQGALAERALNHDQSKIYDAQESPVFAEFTPKLKGLVYGSDEYKASLQAMGPAVRHHQTTNRHHPEFFVDGVAGMNLIDLLEMLCDWKAATLRSKDGDIHKSIEHSAERFGLSPQLVSILRNTVDAFFA